MKQRIGCTVIGLGHLSVALPACPRALQITFDAARTSSGRKPDAAAMLPVAPFGTSCSDRAWASERFSVVGLSVGLGGVVAGASSR